MTKDGEAVLNHLASIGYVNDATYVPGDTHETAHREGMRRIVISILRFIDKSPQELLNLQQENINE
jgi:DNA gyrase/topoisomerase IV subunit B